MRFARSFSVHDGRVRIGVNNEEEEMRLRTMGLAAAVLLGLTSLSLGQPAKKATPPAVAGWVFPLI